ncbi:MAG: Fe-S cluster assembly protein SufD [Kordiimonadales bacterium]|nr:MAG: Fe-S cluster assembly protein SufD [Kordiimonadales bacterium]
MNEHLVTGYQTQSKSLLGTIPGADNLRSNAMRDFEASGFPTSKTEAWRYTSTKLLRDHVFNLAPRYEASVDLPPALGETAARLVFINGRYDEEASDFGDLWQAISIRSLANHFMSNEDRANELVRGNDGLSYLNTALLRDGLVFSVPSGIQIDDPIEIVHIVNDAADGATHIRQVIELGEGSSITIIERFIGDDSAYWTNSVLQARVTENSKLQHIRVQEEGPNATHTAKAYINLGAGAQYHCTNIALGGKVSRFEAHVRILVDEANATVNGVALAGSGQSHDMLTHINHTVPNATSNQTFRTIADKRGKTSFQGKITVEKAAQNTLADQSFKALVFDKTAEANAKPELEILADDVKCAHGATVGQLDDEAIFYLTSRGIDPVEARKMLVESFTADALEAISNDDIKAAITTRINDWMAIRAGSLEG